jgi:hypothetical protein
MATLVSNTSERGLQYASLRKSYNAAFRLLAGQTRRRQLIAAHVGGGETAPAEMEARIDGAAQVVRCRRDRIADFLLNPIVPERLTHLRVQQAAYFLWLNAGCPDGSSASDWFNAQRQYAQTEQLMVR